jgi:hypothetical protein
VNNHNQSIRALNTGKILAGRPALGSWLTYGLGSESQDLPAFVVLNDPAGFPIEGVNNWSNGWLPSLYQATVIRHKEPRILDLDPPAQRNGEIQDGYRTYLRHLNRRHLERHPDDPGTYGFPNLHVQAIWATACQSSGSRGTLPASWSPSASLRNVVKRIQPWHRGQRPANPVPCHQERTSGLYTPSGSLCSSNLKSIHSSV